MTKIKVKNFGPIQEGLGEEWIDIKKVTVFIGNQASGKSTIAKLFSLFTWLEKQLVLKRIEDEITVKKTGKKGDREFKKIFARNCFAYHGISDFFKTDTTIEYQGSAFIFGITTSPSKKKGLDVTIVFKETKNTYKTPKLAYIPAERNTLSFLEGIEKLKLLPKPLFDFLVEWETALSSLKVEGIKLPIGEFHLTYDKLRKIPYIHGEDYKIKLSRASSGLQSIAPLFLVAQNLSNFMDRANREKELFSLEDRAFIQKQVLEIIKHQATSNEKDKKEELKDIAKDLFGILSRVQLDCFINIVEEPEQNLFPDSQQKVLHELLGVAGKSPENKLLFTTHSPYLIRFLGVVAYAKQLLDKSSGHKNEKELSQRIFDILPKYALINTEDYVIYEMQDGGCIRKIEQYQGIPKDNQLMQGLHKSSELIDQLIDIEEDIL